MLRFDPSNYSDELSWWKDEMVVCESAVEVLTKLSLLGTCNSKAIAQNAEGAVQRGENQITFSPNGLMRRDAYLQMETLLASQRLWSLGYLFIAEHLTGHNSLESIERSISIGKALIDTMEQIERGDPSPSNPH